MVTSASSGNIWIDGLSVTPSPCYIFIRDLRLTFQVIQLSKAGHIHLETLDRELCSYVTIVVM